MIVALTGLVGSSYAQGGGGRGEEIRNMKIAFITEALELSPAESEKFWPQYNQYWSERREIGHRRRDLFKKIKEGRATDAELKGYVSIMDAEKRLVEKYIIEFKKVIPVEKVARLFVADEDFKNYLLRKTAATPPPAHK